VLEVARGIAVKLEHGGHFLAETAAGGNQFWFAVPGEMDSTREGRVVALLDGATSRHGLPQRPETAWLSGRAVLVSSGL
jgi:hypothetical protein